MVASEIPNHVVTPLTHGATLYVILAIVLQAVQLDDVSLVRMKTVHSGMDLPLDVKVNLPYFLEVAYII